MVFTGDHYNNPPALQKLVEKVSACKRERDNYGGVAMGILEGAVICLGGISFLSFAHT